VTRIHTVIVGGGQAGLAMSRCLSDHAIDHVVLERGRVGERWRSERWDSLRLLTPNWLSRLPGYEYDGPDPDGYMTMPEVVAFLDRYAAVSNAPVQESTAVTGIRRTGDRFEVASDRGAWLADNVVVATGYCDQPVIPGFAAGLSKDIAQLVPTQYRRPDQLPPGGVLVVGASASGIQLAEELAEAGRAVSLAVGRHIRLPRLYRGKDILWWLDRMGLLDARIEDVIAPDASRAQSSLQLVGRPDHHTLDLGTLQDLGVRLLGRASAADGAGMSFDDDLVGTTAASDVKLASLTLRIDEFAETSGLAASVGPAVPFVPLWPRFARSMAPTSLDLQAEGISTVIWATGFRRRYPWLQVPVLDERGDIRHRGGVTPVDGLYVLGMQFQQRRKSAFIDGAGADARELTDHILRRQNTGDRYVAV
jgi:putative flavoprotein involved in K+ transport